MNKLLPYLSILSMLLLQACSGSMQTRNISPYFDGVLKSNNEAINGAKIMLSIKEDDPLCYHSIQETQTNEQGQFSLTPAKEQKSYIPFLNFELNTWTLCAKYKNQRYTLYSNNRYDGGNISESHQLDCDLTTNPINKLCTLSF
jgi:Domain of unknown function (DUF6795)